MSIKRVDEEVVHTTTKTVTVADCDYCGTRLWTQEPFKFGGYDRDKVVQSSVVVNVDVSLSSSYEHPLLYCSIEHFQNDMDNVIAHLKRGGVA